MRKIVFACGLALVFGVSPADSALQAPQDRPPASTAEEAPRQPPASPAPTQAPAAGAVTVGPTLEPIRRGEVFRFGRDYTLEAGEEAQDVVIIGGSVMVAGRTRDLVVLLGSARLASTAVVDGDLVVIGGNAMVEPGAVASRDLVVVGGTLDGPADFAVGGEQIIVGSAFIGEWFRTGLPWLTRGLIWGRLIVPDLPWVWVLAALVLLVYLAINLAFQTPVNAAAHVLSEKPLTAFLVGLLVLLATGPVTLVLMITVAGIVVIPFLWCALFLAGLLGKVSAVRWIGANLVREESPGGLQSARSLVIGFALMCLAYMVPVLGLVVWVSLGVLGMGAATLAFVAGLRRENPAPPAPEAPPLPPPPHPPNFAGTAPAGIEPPGSAGGVVSGAMAGATDLTLLPRATFLTRLGALVLDLVLVLLVSAFLNLDIDDSPGRLFLLLLVYHVVFWAWQGTTVGGIICQLRVVRTDGGLVRFVDALVRGLSGIFSFAVLGLGFLWILRDPERQAWHDRIAGTYVVRVPKDWRLA